MKNSFLPVPFLLAILVTQTPLTGCAPHQTRQSTPAATQGTPAQVKYCPVNLFDVRDIRPCFDSQVACQASIAKSTKYVCNPQSALKYPPKQP